MYILVADPVQSKLTKKRNQLIALGILLALGSLLITIMLDVLGSDYQIQIEHQREKSSLTARLQINFKTQVQEWKNVIIRNDNQQLYEKHLRAFLDQQAIVTGLSLNLRKRITPETRQSKLFADFNESYIELNNMYGEVLNRFEPGTRNFASKVDFLVRGNDRFAASLLDKLDKEIQRESIRTEEELRQATIWTEAAVLLLVISLITSLTLYLGRTLLSEAKKTYEHPVSYFYNKIALFVFLDELVKSKKNVSLFLFDIDDFKSINEVVGVKEADRIIQNLSRYYRSFTRYPTFHISSNFFITIVTECSSNHDAIHDGLIDVLEDFSGKELKNSISVNFTTCTIKLSCKDQHPNSLFNKINACMQEAKQQSKGKSHNALKLIPLINHRQLLMRTAQSIEYLIGSKKLDVIFQAIVPNRSGNSMSNYYEALLRVSEQGALKPPSIVLEAAELYGKASLIDKFVFQKVVTTILNTDYQITCSVNVSSRSLEDTSFTRHVVNTLKRNSKLAGSLVFEVTESAAIKKISNAKCFFNECRALGSKIAIDDFGVGESSLKYLLELPVDIIKIDGFFIKALESSDSAKQLLQVIVQICKDMGLDTVAEYVENENIRKMVTKLGVTYSQGFAIHKPSKIHSFCTEQQLLPSAV